MVQNALERHGLRLEVVCHFGGLKVSFGLTGESKMATLVTIKGDL
jgi:hypothetical protein